MSDIGINPGLVAFVLEKLRGDGDISDYDGGVYILTPEGYGADHPLAVVVEVQNGKINNVHPVDIMEASDEQN